MTGKILEIIRLKNTVLRNGWDLLRHAFGYLKEALIRCQADSRVLLVTLLLPLLVVGSPPPPPFHCPNNNRRIALRRLYMEHMTTIDTELVLAVKSLEEQESLPQHENVGWSNWKHKLPASVPCYKLLRLDTGRPWESVRSLPFPELQDDWGHPQHIWRAAVASVTYRTGS